MAKVRFLLAAFALLWVAVSSPLAQERGKDDRKGDDRGSAGRKSYMGRITRVDSDKHTFVLGDLMDQGKGTGGIGTTGKDTGGTGTTGKDTGGTGKTGPGGSERDRTITFKLTDNAKVTLDGKEATFRDLRSGLYARVHVDQGRTGTTGTGDKTTTGEKGRTEDKGGTGGTENKSGKGADGTAGQIRTASKVEAFTKAPSRTETGGTTGKTTGKDRD